MTAGGSRPASEARRAMSRSVPRTADGVAGVAAGDDGRGRVRRRAGAEQTRGYALQAGEAHQYDQRARQGGQAGEVLRQAVGRVRRVGGDDVEAAAERAVGEGDARLGGHGQGGADAGHLRAGYARGAQGEQLLPAAAEHEGVAALEAHHREPGVGELYELLADVLLAGGGLAGALAHIDELGARPGQGQDVRVDQIVVYQRAAAGYQLAGADGEQPGAAAAGAGDIDLACTHISSIKPENSPSVNARPSSMQREKSAA